MLYEVITPFAEPSINLGLRKAHDAGYDHEMLEDIVDDMLDKSLI